MAAPRWYFNPEIGQCSQFLYGGCDGNENNFVTLSSCMSACESNGNGSNEKKKTIKIEPLPEQRVKKIKFACEMPP